MSFPKRPFSAFRSEEMVLCQFFIQDEVAFSCIEALGHLDAVQFRDVNHELPPKDRPYYAEISMLIRAQTILRHIEMEIEKKGLKIVPEGDDIPTPIPGDLLDIKETLEKFYKDVKDLAQYIQNLKTRYNETIEEETVLKVAKNNMQITHDDMSAEELSIYDEDIEVGSRAAAEMKAMKINIIGGVLRREKFPPFEQTLWRASRGKIFAKFEHIDYEFQEIGSITPVLKTAFIVFSQGERLRNMIQKIADGFRAKLYPIPEEPEQYQEAIERNIVQRRDLKTIIEITEKHYEELLNVCADNLDNWYTQVIKMSAVYNAMNNFTVKPHIGEGWLAISELPRVRSALKKASRDAGGLSDPIINVTECSEEPPTYFWNNKFTAGFQALIDSYGIATYQEVNPMPYTVITFPFLFSLMFGDIGHGMLMLAFGLTMIIREKAMIAEKSKDEIRNILFGGRYIITMMGIFSMYTGFIYNECFACSFNIFGNSWSIPHKYEELRKEEVVNLDPAKDFRGEPYAFGIDPIWVTSQNSIIFLNSFKMKISIIFGVLQMVFGLFLSLWNNCYFGLYSNIFCMFIPELLWMIALFGYLCFLMVFKWFAYGPTKPYKRGTTCAPSVLIRFIGMMLHSKPEAPTGCELQMFPFQNLLEKILFGSAMICIPWLLCMKPICVFKKPKGKDVKKTQTKEKANKKEEIEKQETETERKSDAFIDVEHCIEDKGVNVESENKGEFMIHQGIHTIEFVLGTVSHTASYLRLWALSLAHSQLSEVLWSMVLAKAVGLSLWVPYGGFLIILLAWMMWAVLTIAILVLMEGLSAFLHTLRLHWVEFNSKFYSGLGYEFTPFSFRKILSAERI